jgi:hypothetical protein
MLGNVLPAPDRCPDRQVARCSAQGLHRPCRARPADRSLVAEDRSAEGVRDRTGPELPRRLQRLAYETLATEGGPSPRVKAGPSGATAYHVILTGRATSVPVTAVMTGPERTTTDKAKAASTSVVRYLRRSQTWPIWLWEQEVASTAPVSNLVRPETDSNASAAGSSTARGRSGLVVAVAVTFSRRSWLILSLEHDARMSRVAGHGCWHT